MGCKYKGLCLQYKNYDVWVLLSWRGNAIEMHGIAKGRKAKLQTRNAVKEVIEMIPKIYPDCKMLIAPVKMHSVFNLCKKLGFEDMGNIDFERDNCRVMVIKFGDSL